MTAVAHPLPTARPRTPALRRCGPVQVPRRPAAVRPTTGGRPTAAQFRRRRAVVSLVAVVLLGAGVALGVPADVPLTSFGLAPAARGVPANALAVGEASSIVRPGDTLWEIARALQPAGDVRPLVQRLAAARGGAPLRVGERLVLPRR